jgi:hypothetical protein
MVFGSCLGTSATLVQCPTTRSPSPIRQAIKCSSVAGSSAQRRQASARCAPDRLRSSRAPRGRARRMWEPIPHSQVTFSDVRDDGFVGSAECAIIHAQIEVGSLRFDARQQQRPVSWFRSPGRLGCGSFVSRHALVSQKALVGSAVHQGAAFLTGHAISGRFDHGDFVFGSAVAFMRSGEPFYEFGHVRNMRPDRSVAWPISAAVVRR